MRSAGPGLTGTGFGGSRGRSSERSRFSLGVVALVLERWDVAEAFVQVGGVVPADVLDDGELVTRSPGAVGDQLCLEAVDERLGQRVDAPMSSRRRLGHFGEHLTYDSWCAGAGYGGANTACVTSSRRPDQSPRSGMRNLLAARHDPGHGVDDLRVELGSAALRDLG